MIYFDRLGLVGRLGNALYQLASTAGIAAARGVEPRFNANWIHRPYFSVPDALFTDDFGGGLRAEETPNVRHIDPRHRIYLQDHNLFADILPTLREWLAPSDLAQSIMEVDVDPLFDAFLGPVLSVHVRRGDNAPGGDPGTPDKHLYHPMPSLSYYQAAAQAMAEHEPVTIAAFSDDPDWVERMLPFADYVHRGVVRPKEHEPDYLTAPVLDWIDWQLQVRCDLHICSNSTFGIMAALIADDDVPPIVPWPIFGPKLRYIDASLLFPRTWRRMSNNPAGEPHAARS